MTVSNFLLSLYIYHASISVLVLLIMIPYLYDRVKAGAVNLFICMLCAYVASHILQCIAMIGNYTSLLVVSGILIGISISILSYIVLTRRFDLFIVTRKNKD